MVVVYDKGTRIDALKAETVETLLFLSFFLAPKGPERPTGIFIEDLVTTAKTCPANFGRSTGPLVATCMHRSPKRNRCSANISDSTELAFEKPSG